MTRFAFQMSRHMRLFELIRQQDLVRTERPEDKPASGPAAHGFISRALSSLSR